MLSLWASQPTPNKTFIYIFCLPSSGDSPLWLDHLRGWEFAPQFVNDFSGLDSRWGCEDYDCGPYWVSVLDFLVWRFICGAKIEVSKFLRLSYGRSHFTQFSGGGFWIEDIATFCQVCLRLFQHLIWQITLGHFPPRAKWKKFPLCRVWGNTCSLGDQSKLKPLFNTCSK